MKKSFSWILTFAMGVGVIALRGAKRRDGEPDANAGQQTVHQRPMSAAFRDGVYLGKFDTGHHNPRHVSSGRWATGTDRTAFAAGYEQGYREGTPSEATVSVSRAIDGAFRDGQYLGKFDEEQGREQHMAVGRWSTAGGRNSFTAGYQRSYREATLARAKEGGNIEQAFLTR